VESVFDFGAGGGCSDFVVVALKRSYCCESVVAEAAVLFVDVREDRRK
jgi:hypothetical protein